MGETPRLQAKPSGGLRPGLFSVALPSAPRFCRLQPTRRTESLAFRRGRLNIGHPKRGNTLAMLFGFTASLACATLLACWEDLRVWGDQFSKRYHVGDTIDEENRLGRR